MKREAQNDFAPKKSFKEFWEENTSGKAFRVGGYSAIAVIIVVVIAVIINLGLGKLPSSMTQLDTTKDQLSSISQQTKQIVSGLKDDVTIYWIAQKGNEDFTIEQMLSRYEDLSKHIKVEQKDPVVNPNFASQYTDTQVTQNSLIVVCGDRHTYVAYTDIYVTDYSAYYTTGQTTTTFYGESCITGAIDYVTSDTLPKMYMLGGHGGAAMDSALSNMVVKQNIEVAELNLVSEGTVPADCNLLLIFAPENDLSKDEAAAITDYLSKGGKLLLVSQYTDKAMPNLAGVMAYYGASLKDGICFDADTAHYYQVPYMILPDINEHAITEPLIGGYYVLYPQTQALDITGSKPDSVIVTSLLSTSNSGYIKTNVQTMTSYDKEDGNEEGKFELAAAMEDSDTGAQLVWFTNAYFTLSSYDEAVSGTNTDLFLNAIGWMCQSENNITIHAKTITNDYLTVPAATTAILSLVMIGVLPLAFIAIGIYVTISRKKK